MNGAAHQKSCGDAGSSWLSGNIFRRPNPWAETCCLYNMAGNVSEWVMDVYRPLSHQDFDDLNPIRRDDFLDDHTSYKNGYSKTKNDSSKSFTYQKKPDNFQSLVSDKVRVYKGGSWKDVAYWMSPGTRRFLDEDSATATIGFRCAMIKAGSNY
jgi:gliding motility-associated lipoprotein GldJ